jgi:hypothetical protein
MKKLMVILVSCAFLLGTAAVARASMISLGAAGALFGLKVISDANKTEKKDVKAENTGKKDVKPKGKKTEPKKK